MGLYRLERVQQQYDQRVVLDVSRLVIHAGEILALVGPSGAGKSTLLRLLAFLERPSAGQFHYHQQLVSGNWPDLAARRQVTMVFQRPSLLRRSVRYNIAYGLRLRRADGPAAQQRIDEMMAQLGLTELATARAVTLSGGEMQRVALARALVLQPKVLLLDEPTANLDPYNVRLIEEMVVRANQEAGVTVVIVTHNIFQARRLAQRVGLLWNGRMVEVAATDTFFDAPTQAETAAFVGGELIY